MNALLSAGRGFAMGAADLVPGVSGGTVALVLGIYERLIASVRMGSAGLGHLLRGDLAAFRDRLLQVEWGFIVPLGTGVLVAIVLLATALERLLHEQPVLMAAIFFGLVAGSVVVTWRLIRDPGLLHAGVMFGVGAIVSLLVGLTGATEPGAAAEASDPAVWTFFGAGAIAICAMILPGVSGSFLLILMGMYGPVLSALSQRDVVAMGAFLLGAVVGLALFSQLLHRALERHHDLVLAVLIGLMAGSMRVLWPWPEGVFSTQLGVPEGAVLAPVAAAVLAFIGVMAVGRSSRTTGLVAPEPRLAEAT